MVIFHSIYKGVATGTTSMTVALATFLLNHYANAYPFATNKILFFMA